MTDPAGDTMLETQRGVIEPVHWGSRLVRSDAFVYTEVDGTPLLVRPDDGAVEALTPTWVGIWAQLDGRPAHQSLRVDPEELDPVDARNLIEVLRRLKASGVVRDAEPSDSEPGDPEFGLADPPAQQPLKRFVDFTLTGSITRVEKTTSLHVDASDRDAVTIRIAEAPDAPILSVRRRLRRRRIDRIDVVDSAGSHAPEGPVDVLVLIIRALCDREVLLTPGLLDLLAEVAERVAAPASPVR